MTSDLITFLTARLDEDEAAALAATGTAWAWEATGDKDNSWAVGHVEDEDGRPLSGEIEHGQGVIIDGVCEGINGRLADAAHISRHDPARVLREVEAKRAILAVHAQLNGSIWCQTCDPGADPFGDSEAWYPCRTMRLLAAVYIDHADYQQEWE